MDWSTIEAEFEKVAAPRPPIDPPPVPLAPPANHGWDRALDKAKAAIDRVMAKPVKLPIPIPCDGCGGLVWA